MTHLKVKTDKNVCLNFPLVRLDGSNGNGGCMRVSVPKDTLSSLLRENQPFTLTLEGRKRFKGRIKGMTAGNTENILLLFLTVNS